MTVILMTYIMIIYNISINSKAGLINNTFLYALKEFPIEVIIVFVCAYFVAGPIAKKNTFKMFNKNDKSIFIILSIQTFTVLIMVGLMSIYALFSNNLFNSNVICNYIVVYFKNLLFAYPLQLFFVGPIVRKTFRLIFNN